MSEIAWVAIGGMLGAVSRFLINNWTVRYVTATFPLATVFINLTGSFLIGFFIVRTTERVLTDPRWRLFVAIGFCGAFTTYSSFAFETLKMSEFIDSEEHVEQMMPRIQEMVGNRLITTSEVAIRHGGAFGQS